MSSNGFEKQVTDLLARIMRGETVKPTDDDRSVAYEACLRLGVQPEKPTLTDATVAV